MKDGYVVVLGPVDVDEYYWCTTSPLPGVKCFVRKEEVLPSGLVVDAAGVLEMPGRKIYLLDTPGEDEYTDFLVESLERLQTDTRHVEWLAEYRNLRATIYLSERERTAFIHENDKPPVTVNDEMRELLRNVDFLYTTIYNPREPGNYRELVGGTKESRTGIMVDVEPITFLDRESEEDDPLFRMADIISSNEASHEKCCRRSDADLAKKLAEENGPIVMATMGERECRTCGDGKEYHIPASRMKMVGTTGAGDTHNRVFLYGYLKGWGIERTGMFAAAAAARAVTEKEAWAGAMPERMVLEFLERLQHGDGWEWE